MISTKTIQYDIEIDIIECFLGGFYSNAFSEANITNIYFLCLKRPFSCISCIYNALYCLIRLCYININISVSAFPYSMIDLNFNLIIFSAFIF